MAESISSDLIERIRERLAVDWRRTGDGNWLRMPQEWRHRNAPAFPMSVMWKRINDAAAAEEMAKELKPIEPLDEKAVAKVEKSLGRKLPPQLRQLYLEIGDGGYGPFSGLRRLSTWAKDYSKLCAETPKERGREWPEGLLPIVYMNGKRICVDAASGEVVLWSKPPKKASEKKWLASFIPQSPSVEEWLERWVDTPTEAEDGPEGGWTPPAEEVARREAVVQDAEAKREAEAEKARTLTPADLPPLADNLIERIATRALDPERRTYMAGAQGRSAPFGLDEMEDELVRNAQHIPGHAFGTLAGIMKGLGKLAPMVDMPKMNMVMGVGGGMVMMKSGAGGKLGQPATEAALAHADDQLGFALPEPLRQLLRIADGGFGPGDGLLSVARTLSLYRKLTAKPQGPGAEHWPAKLLPIWQADEEIGCLDLETGAVTSYDPSRMQDIHGGYWRRSFAKEASSLAELMQKWLGETTFDEDAKPDSQMMREYRESLPPEEDPGEIAVAYFAKMSPEDRANAGLPEVGWEDELRRRHRGPW